MPDQQRRADWSAGYERTDPDKREHHPDNGGDRERFAEVVRAEEEVLEDAE